MLKTKIPLVEFTREELKKILLARDKRCVITGKEGTDAHEFIFKRSERHGEGRKSRFWHPYNAVLLNNAYHIDGAATSSLDALKQLQHLLNWHGETELNNLIDWIDLRIKPVNIEQWAWRRAMKLGITDLSIADDLILVNGQPFSTLNFLQKA